MSTWRRKAIELFPDLQKEFEQPRATIYSVFFELLPRVHLAHELGDEEELRRIYGFAAWCFQQKSKDLWNSAGVVFYEHLVDRRTTRDEIPRWLAPDQFADLKELFAARMEPEKYQQLCDRYENQSARSTRQE
jgi:16S rRNA A1518/A1519 N6-dimethyltransferase RsmA/KsgA/DIM1 with predicted DNA glycosylase/AP lyase activity